MCREGYGSQLDAASTELYSALQDLRAALLELSVATVDLCMATRPVAPSEVQQMASALIQKVSQMK
jgi:hypothetical protein